MTEYLIGTGGWAYFNVSKTHPLEAYSKAFNFVEVISTFYEIPKPKTFFISKESQVTGQ